ncbi:alpha-glucan water dikinase [Salix suchowensis]|nr:alpha-glucan water dikinase [Salix suchowensis]
MAVLIQEVICGDYTFAIHTKNPLSGIPCCVSRLILSIQTKIVKGLGDFVGGISRTSHELLCQKMQFEVSYSSLPKCIRLGSNGEDLEGYAGAGLYDSALIDEEEKIVLDNSIARIIVDKAFHTSLLNNC